jgi:CubicO group peptidase (beta-lactamase class C family)
MAHRQGSLLPSRREFITFLGGAAALIASMVAANAQLALPTPLPDTPEAFGTALKTWAAKYSIERALVVVRRQGKIVYRSTFGGADASTPVHLASLSKTITGACVAMLIRDRKLAFDTPLSTSLAKFFVTHGKPVDPRTAGVTIAQLLTHRAGFSGDADEVRELVAYLKENSARQPPKPELLINAFKIPLPHQPGSDYVYSNTGYLVLGAIIEEATGKPYLSYCREAVLAPLGITGGFDPDWQVMGAYGAWRLTGDAYLSVMDLFAAKDQRLGNVAKTWMLSPDGKTIAPDSPVWYGFGTMVSKAGGGVNVWNWGSWLFNLTGAIDGTLKSSFLTFAVRESSGTSSFVQAAPRVDDGPPRLELDRALFGSFGAVKRWN